MRKIKFRAWDKIEGKMWVPIIDQDGVPCVVHPISRHLVKMDGELLDPVMQYTGLKDKNGREIYEGDIVRGPHDFGPAGFSEWTGVVQWCNYSGYRWSYWEVLKIEVIGNIYENPELMPKEG